VVTVRLQLCWFVAVVAAAHASDGISTNRNGPNRLLGGDTTVFDETRSAFSFPARNIHGRHRSSFFVGNSFFNQNWLMAPASTAARDGLGPLFNARSCSTCHFKDGRGRPPDAGEPMSTMLLRISVPGTNAHGGPRPHHVYGNQIQGAAVPAVSPEADVFVDYEGVAGTFADGEKFMLRRPVYRIGNPGYGVLPTNLLTSARVAPHLVGLGLLEAVPEATLHSLCDPEDRDGDGISGRVNLVWDIEAASRRVGRFGWKAEEPTVRQQTAAAFCGDIGITSALLPDENHTAAQSMCSKQPSGGAPEIGQGIFDDVVLYARVLAVPAQRQANDTEVLHGQRIFAAIGCVACHVPALITGDCPDLPELSRQTIHPYTDLLLHDMGPGLADGRPAYVATGREWRTPPLWGLGLLQKVNGHTFLLHDGRARDFGEAILWHDGEARFTREKFRELSKKDRRALIRFLESL
jgi:CxxC motif-containing protein (DUF1111 family)